MNYLIKQDINGHQDFFHIDCNIASMLAKNVRALQLVSDEQTYKTNCHVNYSYCIVLLHMLSVLANFDDECAHTSVSTYATMSVHRDKREQVHKRPILLMPMQSSLQVTWPLALDKRLQQNSETKKLRASATANNATENNELTCKH